jgi:hypothetical protein
VLAPHVADFERVFVGKWAAHARAGYAAWRREEVLAPDPTAEQVDVRISGVIPAFMLATDNGASRQHPGGLRAVAPMLQPDLHWVSWKYARPGTNSGIAFDGLVRVEGERFAWFPRVWIALNPQEQ